MEIQNLKKIMLDKTNADLKYIFELIILGSIVKIIMLGWVIWYLSYAYMCNVYWECENMNINTIIRIIFTKSYFIEVMPFILLVIFFVLKIIFCIKK